MDYCKFFKEIEKDPSAPAPQMTVSQFLGARRHIATCAECSKIVDRVVASAPPQKLKNKFMEN